MENTKIMNISKQVFCVAALTGFLGMCLTESGSAGGKLKLIVFFILFIVSTIVRLILQNPKIVLKYTLLIISTIGNIVFRIIRGLLSMVHDGLGKLCELLTAFLRQLDRLHTFATKLKG